MSHRPRRLGAPIAAAVAVIILVDRPRHRGRPLPQPHTTTSPTIGKGHKGKVAPTPPRRRCRRRSRPARRAAPTPRTPAVPVLHRELQGNHGSVLHPGHQLGRPDPVCRVLNPGQTKQIVLTGTSKVQLGAPSSVTIQIDKTPVTFPNPIPAPLNITFAGVTLRRRPRRRRPRRRPKGRRSVLPERVDDLEGVRSRLRMSRGREASSNDPPTSRPATRAARHGSGRRRAQRRSRPRSSCRPVRPDSRCGASPARGHVEHKGNLETVTRTQRPGGPVEPVHVDRRLRSLQLLLRPGETVRAP